MNESNPPPAHALGRSFLVGSFYVGLGNWISTPLNFVIQILIARMLGPKEFGLYAFVLAVSGVVQIVGSFSMGLALIQNREESQDLYDTALAITVGLGFIGLMISGAVAPLLWFYRTPQAAWFLLVLVLGQMFTLSAAVPNARLERTLRYGPLSVIALTSRSVPNLIALWAVWSGFGVWSLPIRDVCTAVLDFGLKTLVARYRFRGRVDRESGRTLMSFGRPIFMTRGLDAVFQWADRVAVGAFLGNTATGLYHQARLLAETGLIATRPLFPMVFNLYSRVQDQPQKLSRSFSIVSYFLARATSAGAVVLVVFPAETVQLLLGDDWVGTAPLLRWLALYTVFLPLLSNFRQLLSGTGNVARNARIAATQLALFVPAVLVSGMLESSAGVAASLVLVTLVGLLLSWSAGRQLLGKFPIHLATPAALCAGIAVLFVVLHRTGVVDEIVWYVRPFLPALLYGVGLLALEFSRLRGELVYLRRQLVRGEEAGRTP